MGNNGTPKLLIVDDEESIRKILVRKFESLGYECATAANGEEGVEKAKGAKFDAVLSDVKMPVMTGVEMIPVMRAMDSTISVVLLTAFADVDVAVEALRCGAFDFELKPMEFDRLEKSVANAVERTRLLREKAEYTRSLEEKVRERTIELERRNEKLRKFFLETVMALVTALEAKDRYTEGHSKRVAENARTMAAHMGLPQEEVERIYISGVLHDVGKIGIPDAVLLKPGFFTEPERKAMQAHPTLTAGILANVEDFQEIVKITLHHHERVDGKGYPAGIKDGDIPLGAKIIAVADAFDAMTSDRPYRPKIRLETAISEISIGSGSQFDPEVCKAFMELLEKDAVIFEVTMP